jgi:hypothetical protein
MTMTFRMSPTGHVLHADWSTCGYLPPNRYAVTVESVDLIPLPRPADTYELRGNVVKLCRCVNAHQRDQLHRERLLTEEE